MFKKYFIDEDFKGARFDRWFKKTVSNVPQSYLEKNLRIGKIKVNKKKIKSSYKLRTSDEVMLHNLEPKHNKHQIKQFKYNPNEEEIFSTSSVIVESNENFIIVNKPRGIAVQSGTKSRRNIIDILRKTKEFKDSTPYIVHRIDKDTTGILIVAKNRKYAQLFTSLFRIRKIKKTYLALVLGEMKDVKGTFKDFLYQYEGKKEIRSEAITHYSVIDSNNKYSILKLIPETGRKHQLRKQLLMHGHPIIGDRKYRMGDFKFGKNNYMMLHAWKISFSVSNIKYKFAASLPVEFQNTIKEKRLKIY